MDPIEIEHGVTQCGCDWIREVRSGICGSGEFSRSLIETKFVVEEKMLPQE